MSLTEISAPLSVLLALMLIRPPSGRIGPVTAQERKALIEASPIYGKYEEREEAQSAYEMLEKRKEEATAAEASQAGSWINILMGSGTGRRQGYGEAFAKSMVRSVATTIGNAIAKAVTGGKR